PVRQKIQADVEGSRLADRSRERRHRAVGTAAAATHTGARTERRDPLLVLSRPRQCGRFSSTIMSDPGPNLAAALALAVAGVKIFRAGADRRPLSKQWQEIATADCDIISEWWRRAPYALPAIPCGANGLLVIDLDRHGNGSDGVSAFKALVACHGALPPGVPM